MGDAFFGSLVDEWAKGRANALSAARREQARQDATPDLARRLAKISRTWSWVPPGVQLATAKAGKDAFDPLLASVGQAAAKTNSWAQLGDIVRGTGKPGKKQNPLDPPETPHPNIRTFDDALKIAKSDKPLTPEDAKAAYQLLSQGQNKFLQRHSLKEWSGLIDNLDLRSKGINPKKVKRDPITDRYVFSNEDAQKYDQADVLGRGLSFGQRAIQSAGIVADAPLQAVTGALRVGIDNPGGIVQDPVGTLGHVAEQTTLGQVIGGKDPGGGFLVSPDSEAGKAQSAAARRYSPWLVNGHAWTPGRAIANELVDQDTVPYALLSGGVDAAFSWKADPVSLGAKAAEETRAASKLFTAPVTEAEALDKGVNLVQDFGGYRGVRKWVDKQAASQFKFTDTGKDFDAMVTAAATSGDRETAAYELWRRSKGNLPVQGTDGRLFLADLVDAAKDPERQIWDVVDPQLGTSVRARPDLAGSVPHEYKTDSRMYGLSPGNSMDPRNPRAAAETADAWLRNAKIPYAQRAKLVGRILTDNRGPIVFAEVGGDMAKQAIITNVRRSKGTLTAVQEAALEQRASALTRMMPDDEERLRAFYTEANGDPGYFPAVALNGEGHALPTKQLDSEELHNAFELPDAREIRRLTSKYPNFFTNPAVDFGRSASDFVIGNLWKRTKLLRIAWGVRVVGEEQVRMAWSGLPSLFAHPVRAMAIAIGGDPEHPEIRKWLTRVQGAGDKKFLSLDPGSAEYDKIGRRQQRAGRIASKVGGRHATDLEGVPFVRDDAVTDTMNTVFADFLPGEHGRVPIGDYVAVPPSHPQFAEGWAGELGKQARSRIVKGILNAESPEAAVDWFTKGEGRSYYLDAMEDAKRRIAGGANVDELGQAFADGDPDAARQWLGKVVERVSTYTKNDPKLIEALRSGKLNGFDVLDRYGRPTDGFTAGLGEFQPPEFANIERFATLPKEAQNRAREKWDHAFSWLMSEIMAKPSNYFSRSPTLRGYYWERAEELIPFMSPVAKERMLHNLPQANLPKDVVKRISELPAVGELSVHEADVIAKGFAIDKTKHLLYDLSNKSQFMDAFRLAFPFGEAWKEVVTRYLGKGGLIQTHPHGLRRFQQIAEGATQSGAIYTDENGEEVFGYPLSGFVADKFAWLGAGTPIPLKGAVGGLSLMTNVAPAVGPVISWPLSYTLPDTPTYDKIREFLFPFGDQRKGAGPGLDEVIDTFVPNWAQGIPKAVGSPLFQKQYNSKVGWTMRYLLSTGEYDINGPKANREIDRLMRDSKSKATWFSILDDVLGSAVLPAAPSPEWTVKVGKGDNARTVTAQMIGEEFRTKKAELDGDWGKALDWFVNKYGENNILLLVPLSETIVPGVDATKNVLDWEREHGGLVESHNKVWGYFAKQGGEFDIGAYEQQFERGQRKPRQNMREMVETGNRILAQRVYDRLMEEHPDAIADEKRELKDRLAKDYPGYDVTSYDPKIVTTAVREIYRAAKDPKMMSAADSDVRKALPRYLELRDEALSRAKSIPNRAGFGTSKDTQYLRDALRREGTKLVEAYPGFRPMWDQVFSREMKEDA